MLPGGIKARPTWSPMVTLNRNMESTANPQLSRRRIIHAVGKLVPVQDIMDIPSAYRTIRSEIQHFRRVEQRELAKMHRRNIPVQEVSQPLPSCVNILNRPGPRTFRRRGHIDVTSAAFLDARKHSKILQERLESDDAAAQSLYNTRVQVIAFTLCMFKG